MNLSRRTAALGMLSMFAAPAVVKAANLMKIVRVPPLVIVSASYNPASGGLVLNLVGDGIADDTAAIQALMRGERVLHKGALIGGDPKRIFMPPGIFYIPGTVTDINAYMHNVTLTAEPDALDKRRVTLNNCWFKDGTFNWKAES